MLTSARTKMFCSFGPWLCGDPAFGKPLKPPKFCRYCKKASCWICSGVKLARGLNCGKEGVTDAGLDGTWSTTGLEVLGSMLD